MKSLVARPYTAYPFYPPAGEPVASGWDFLAGSIRADVSVVAVDGPAIAGWPDLVAGLGKALGQLGRKATFLETGTWLLPWRRVQQMTSSYELRDDPDFDFLATGRLADLLRQPSHLQVVADGLVFVYGPGAALLPHDVLWYADLPKRYAETAVTMGNGLNLGQPPGAGQATTKRLFFIDWPLLDRHRDDIAGRISFWIDMQDPTAPAVLDGETLRATLADLSVRPFRTRPSFNITPWGGHWAQQYLGHNPDEPNTALGYELIAPEAGVLIGTGDGPRSSCRSSS